MTTPTSEAIEAAAQAMYEDFRLAYNGRFGNTPSWDNLGTSEQDEWRRHARVAAPFMAAQAKAEAWDEGAEALTDHWANTQYSPNANGPTDPPANPYRAATIEGKSE